MLIGELSRLSGVKIPTIRYYEQMGLIEAPERTEGNQRRFTSSELERLSFIKHARELGLSIETIRELIKLGDHPDQPCAEANRIAKAQLVSVRERISQLKRLEKELKRIASSCNADKVADCYVIRALADHSLCEQEH